MNNTEGLVLVLNVISAGFRLSYTGTLIIGITRDKGNRPQYTHIMRLWSSFLEKGTFKRDKERYSISSKCGLYIASLSG